MPPPPAPRHYSTPLTTRPPAALLRQRRPPHDTARPATHDDELNGGERRRRGRLLRRHLHPRPAILPCHPSPRHPPVLARLVHASPSSSSGAGAGAAQARQQAPPVAPPDPVGARRVPFVPDHPDPGPVLPRHASLHHLPGLYGPGGGAVRSHFHGATHATGTLYGHRRARITVAFHESPGSPPCLLLDIAVPTAKFIQDVSAAGMVRVTLECEKQQQQQHEAVAQPRRLLMDEPVWAAEVNGESVGYASRREMTERDARVMQMLHATSMGAGVLPAEMSHQHDGELTYMRAHFDRVVGSKDAETYYMHNPEGGATGPELTIFFIRT
ncbi:hypothetical protein HU200_021187 [Digitaria exilis]|uniref:Protein MIZU-KUSSEI 1 n=1 Tax=Digitaria exilis TaxID=1010633 RepID=A0A835EZZ5_9POAL|nr:hypothetical protein HU200_021187 [Digitaria exilis]